jgi:hypothetical protein
VAEEFRPLWPGVTYHLRDMAEEVVNPTELDEFPFWSEKELLQFMVGQLYVLTDRVTKILELLEGPPPPPGEAVSVQFAKGEAMNLTVDSGTFENTLVFIDDKGDTNATPPEGVTFQYSSDNEAVATVVQDGTNPAQVDGTVVGVEGSADITGTALNADGSVFGTATFTVTVGPGAATGVAWENS